MDRVKILPVQSASSLEQCAQALRDGAVVAIPTETTYGLAADVFNDQAVAAVAALKGRDVHKPMPVLLPTVQSASLLIEEFTGTAAVLATHLWPGPLTMILKARAGLSARILGPNSTIGIRISDSPHSASLLDVFQGPITATSANREGMAPAMTAQEAATMLGPFGLTMVLDGGRCRGGASTVVDVSRDRRPSLVRDGEIPVGEIREILLRELGIPVYTNPHKPRVRRR